MPDIGSKYGSYLGKGALNSVIKWSVIPMMLMTLFHHDCCCYISQGSHMNKIYDYSQHYENYLVGMKLPDNDYVISPWSLIQESFIFSSRDIPYRTIDL